MNLFQWSSRERLLNAATVAATVVMVVVGMARIREPKRTSDATGTSAPTTIADWRPYTKAGTRLGPPSAAVEIVQFFDFQCPACLDASSALRTLRRRHPNDVAVVYRHFPITAFGLEAALAAECGNQAGAFEAIHDALFDEVDSFGVKPWTAIAWQSGIRDTVRFASCMGDSTALDVVRRDALAGRNLGVRGTPSLLIKDQLFLGSPGLKRLEDYIRKALVGPESGP